MYQVLYIGREVSDNNNAERCGSETVPIDRYDTLGELYSTFRQNMSTACDTDPRAAARTLASNRSHLRLMSKRYQCKMSPTLVITPNVANAVSMNDPCI